jgi:hypothetical protein
MGSSNQKKRGEIYPADEKYHPLIDALAAFEDACLDSFEGHISARGIGYAHSRRVTSCVIESCSAEQLVIRGKIKGTRSYTASCQMDLEQGVLRLGVTCSCPYFAKCKHSAALLTEFFSGGWSQQVALFVDSQQGAADVRLVMDGTRKRSLVPVSDELLPLSKETERKLERTRVTQPSLPPHRMTPRYKVGYVLRLDDRPSSTPIAQWSARWSVDSIAVEESARGSRALVLNESEFSLFCAAGAINFAPEDGQLLLGLNVFAAARRRSYGYGDTRTLSQRGDLLIAAIETGRCFFETNASPLRGGPELVAQLGWVTSAKGDRCAAVLNLPPNTIILRAQHPLLYLDRGSGIVGVIRAADSTIDVLEWLALPKIKPPQAAALLSSLRSETLPAQGLEDIEATGAQLEECTPQVLVSIFQAQRADDRQYGGWSFGDRNEAYVLNLGSKPALPYIVKLSFVYGEREVAPDSNARVFSDPQNPERSLLRNEGFEKSVDGELRALGLTPTISSHRRPTRKSEGLYEVWSHHLDYFSKLLMVVAKLVQCAREQGWKTDIPAALMPIEVRDESIGARLRSDSDSPWFEAALDITVGGFSIDLGEVILSLLHRNQHSIAALEMSEAARVVVMLDQQCIEFERTRLLRLLRLVGELSDPQQTDTLRFNRYSGYALESARG